MFHRCRVILTCTCGTFSLWIFPRRKKFFFYISNYFMSKRKTYADYEPRYPPMSKRKFPEPGSQAYWQQYRREKAMAKSYFGRKYAPRQLSSFIPETKYFDTSIEDYAISSADDWTGTEVTCDKYIQTNGTQVDAYTASSLNPSHVGTGYGQIIGSRYKLKGIRIRGSLVPQPASDKADVRAMSVTRLVLVMDINPDGEQAQGEDVFTDFTSDRSNVHSFMNMGSNAKKFRILADLRVGHQPNVAGTDGASTNSVVSNGRVFRMQWKPKKPLVVSLKGPNAATPATAQLQSCNIFLLAQTDSADSVLLHAVSRCYFCE